MTEPKNRLDVLPDELVHRKPNLSPEMNTALDDLDAARITFPVDYTLNQISVVNRARCLRWHATGLNSWSLADWGVALGGEAGETSEAALALVTGSLNLLIQGAHFSAHIGLVLDLIKKLNRVRDELPGNKVPVETLHANLTNELADCYLYLDLLAQAADVNLPIAIRAKFNEVSERHGFPERL